MWRTPVTSDDPAGSPDRGTNVSNHDEQSGKIIVRDVQSGKYSAEQCKEV